MLSCLRAARGEGGRGIDGNERGAGGGRVDSVLGMGVLEVSEVGMLS
jgi:hypothetical protein